MSMKYFNIDLSNVRESDHIVFKTSNAKYWYLNVTVSVIYELVDESFSYEYGNQFGTHKVIVPDTENMKLYFDSIYFLQYNSEEDFEDDENRVKDVEIEPEYNPEEFKKFLQEQGFTQEESENLVMEIETYISENFDKGTEKRLKV